MEFVYLATNERMPGLVKIGKAKDADDRMRSLNAPGVPGKYEAKCICYVKDEARVEKTMHDMLRYAHDDKEFFRVDWLVAAGILITLALEEGEKNDAKPELAKWLRRELLNDTVVIESVPNGQKPKGPVDIKRQRKDFMEYVKVKIGAKRAKVCDGHIQYIDKEVLKSYTVYSIISIEQAEEIISKLPKRGDANTKKYRIIGMPATMGHYVNFLKQSK